jgi:hypothetical protein
VGAETERIGPPPWINCVFSSGVMLARKASLKATPAGAKEVRRLRAASADTHAAATPAHLVRAYHVRYGWTVPIWHGTWVALISALAHKSGAALFLSYGQLPTHFRRWDPTFVGGHCVYVQGTGPKGSGLAGHVWIIDPLAPKYLPGTKTLYRGEWIANTDLRKAIYGGIMDGHAIVLAQGSQTYHV